MIKVVCDRCRQDVDRSQGDWFGVDYQKPPELDESGLAYELAMLEVEHEFHFCSVDCLTEWAFSRAFAPAEQ